MFENAAHHASQVDWDYWITDATPETGPGREEFGAPSQKLRTPCNQSLAFSAADAI